MSETVASPPSEPLASKSLVKRWGFWALPLALLAITFVPYLYGASLADNRRFLWLGYNFDDACVYLSWIKQASSGSLRAYNLFTTDPQNGMLANPLFLALGLFCKITGLSPIVVFHGARVFFGMALFGSLWRLLSLLISKASARTFSYLLLGISSGLGWLPPFWDIDNFNSPIDRWQPEAITFLALYLNPLFLASLALQTQAFLALLQGYQTGKTSYAIKAGGMGALLTLIHTYDVYSVSMVWLLFLVFQTVRPSDRSKTAMAWKQGLLAGAIALPGVLYIAFQLKQETVFRQRADVATLSAPLFWVLFGYGLLILLPLLHAIVSLRRKPNSNPSEPPADVAAPFSTATRFLVVWAVMNVLVAYTPALPFQRKLLQGAHIPIAILAALSAEALISQFRLKPAAKIATKAVLCLILSISNIRFMLRDMSNFASDETQTHIQRPYLKPGEAEALDWIRNNAPADSAVQPLPWLRFVIDPVRGVNQVGVKDMTLSALLPGHTQHKVYCGHFGETPRYGNRLLDLVSLVTPKTKDEERRQILRKMGVRYLIFSQKEPNDADADTLAPIFRERLPIPSYLHKVYTTPDADIYEVSL